MNINARKLLSLLLLLPLSIGVTSCGSKKQNIHTEAQQNFLKDNYEYYFKYAKGESELSRPLPITLSWKEQASSYNIKISESSDLTNSKEITTSSNQVDIYNLKINTTYYWSVSYGSETSKVQTFEIDAQGPRNLYVDGVTNVRDVGGWEIEDGIYSNQGLIYRGARMSENETNEMLITQDGINTMLNDLNIKTDLDIRRTDNNENGGLKSSPLGESVTYTSIPMKTGGNYMLLNNQVFKDVFEVFGDETNYPIYIHCSIGTDRTGVICFFINALIGASEEVLYRDYLFSNFGDIGGVRNPKTIKGYIETINKESGETFADKTYNYLVKQGVETTDLDTLIEVMTSK